MQKIDEETLMSAVLETLKGPTYSDKYPKLPEKLKEMDTDALARVLLQAYRRLVEKREMEFMDLPEAKLTTTIKSVVGWMHRPKFRSTLFLQGTVGSGKTTILEAVRSLYSTIGVSTVFCTAGDIEDQFQRHCFGERNDYDWYKKVGYLFIDDLGTESVQFKHFGTDHTPIQDLLAFRYKYQLTTIITTNLPKSEIWDRYGERIDDRFDEMCSIIKFSGPSYRKMIGKPAK